jgi:hypothetical protein
VIAAALSTSVSWSTQPLGLPYIDREGEEGAEEEEYVEEVVG